MRSGDHGSERGAFFYAAVFAMVMSLLILQLRPRSCLLRVSHKFQSRCAKTVFDHADVIPHRRRYCPLILDRCVGNNLHLFAPGDIGSDAADVEDAAASLGFPHDMPSSMTRGIDHCPGRWPVVPRLGEGGSGRRVAIINESMRSAA